MSKQKQITARLQRGTLVLVAGAFTVWMSGCTAGEEVTVTSASPSPAASSATPAQAFAKPTVPAKDAAAEAEGKVPGLLQSTDPAERTRQVQGGIKSGKDPFSSVPPLVSFKVPVTLPPETQPTVSTPPSTQSQPRTQPKTQPEVKNKPVAVRPNLKLEPRSLIRELPPLPDPTLARGVQVTGVIVVGGVPQAIVQAPNESTSRYVQVGQRIANGQVLVKRIEMNNGSEPIVVLEENGVEVARAIGSPTAPTSPKAAPTARMTAVNLFG